MKSKKQLIFLHLGIVGLLAVYVALVFFTKLDCPIKMFLGFACPFCGLTRAWVSAFQFNFTEAFNYHPLFPVAPVLIFMCFHKKLFKFINAKLYDFILVFMALLFFAVYVIRMIITSGKL